MNSLFLYFWAVLIGGSILWYGFLVVYIGLKAGKEIRELVRTLDKRD
jgi:hypothetical protein